MAKAPPETIGTELPKEIQRCQQLLVDYESIGPAGMFAKAMIKRNIKQAVEALAEGDLVKMIKAYQTLKECQ